AVRALLAWPAAAAWRDRPVYAVGPTTGDAAAAAGFRTVHSAGGTGRELITLIALAADPAAGPLLYPAATDRAVPMDDELTKAGFTVRLIEAYRMEAADALRPEAEAALAAGTIGAAFVYSRRSAA